MSEVTHTLPLTEKIGYSLGDAAANFVWRSTFFLPIFYTDTFGLAAAQVAVLLLVVRLSDGITDIIMGSIADRTNTKQGKFRPWIIWSAPVLALFLALLFTTPDLGNTGKLIYAYLIYFGLTLAYTANNVPYGALMGVMTPSVKERSMLSSFRFVGAFSGGLLVMGLLPALVAFFGKGNDAQGYQYTMIVFAILLVAFFAITYATTKERVVPVINNNASLKSELADLFINLPVILIPVAGISFFFISLSQVNWDVSAKYGAAALCLISFALAYFIRNRLIQRPQSELSHTQKDLVDLLTNTPWLILLVVGVIFGMFTVVRPSAATYYFKYFLNRPDLVGWYFAVTLVASVAAALFTGYMARYISKRNLFIAAFLLGGVFNGAIYFVGSDQITLMFGLAIIGEFFAGIMPVLFFSMLGDTVDYSEWKNNRRATGLIYSAGTFINKTGHGFAGAAVLLVLAAYGYSGTDESTIPGSIEGMKLLMSAIPAGVGLIAALLLCWYPLTEAQMLKIEADLTQRRKAQELAP
jgi:glycoside/pentoside/hexuronide:cation symporter, GPH family